MAVAVNVERVEVERGQRAGRGRDEEAQGWASCNGGEHQGIGQWSQRRLTIKAALSERLVHISHSP